MFLFKQQKNSSFTMSQLTKNVTMLEKQQVVRSLIYWPLNYGYTNMKLKYWVSNQVLKKQYKKYNIQWKTELLIQAMSRNLNITLYTPKIFSLVDKVFLLSWEHWRTWNKENYSNMLFSLSTGRCGFKPVETKTFIAGDTTMRAGLWLIKRNEKKLTPVKLNLAGEQKKLSVYFNRFNLLSSFVMFQDSTPIAFNGCLLKHLPRKRFRRHEYNVQKVANFIEQQQLKK
jgi:hypothetical protein